MASANSSSSSTGQVYLEVVEDVQHPRLPSKLSPLKTSVAAANRSIDNVSVKVLEKESIIQVKVCSNSSAASTNIGDVKDIMNSPKAPANLLPSSLLGSSETTNSINWSAYGLRKQSTTNVSTTPLPSSRNLHESDVFSNTSGIAHGAGQCLKNWVFGDQEYAWLFFESKALLSPWLPAILSSAYMRAIGLPLMINNIISGSIIFYGLCNASPRGAFGTFIGFSSSFLTSIAIWCSRADDERKMLKWIQQGWVSAPSVWLGHHMAHNMCPTGNPFLLDLFQMMPYVALTCIACTLVQMSLLVHLSRLNFHPLHAAHFTGAAFALALMGNLNGGCYALGHHPTGNEEQEPTLRVLWTTGNNDTKSMEKLTRSGIDASMENVSYSSQGITKLSPAQGALKIIVNGLQGWCHLYECQNEDYLTWTCLILLAAFIFSPWTLLDGILGAVVSQLAALTLLPPGFCSKHILEDGSIPLNGILTAIALNFFVILSAWSRLASIFGAILATYIGMALKNVLFSTQFSENSLCHSYDDDGEVSIEARVLLLQKAMSSLPFYLSTMIILLSLTSNRGICQRVDVAELSHPAMHKRLFHPANAVDDDAKI